MLTTNYVPPEGLPSSNFWMIGEAPGAAEDKLLRPFIGPAGQYLDMGLRDAGILRSDIFLWNVFTKRPPQNEIQYYFQDEKQTMLTFEGEEMVRGLRKLICDHRPNLIVALGATAVYILTGKRGITKWRGSMLECILCPDVKV